MGELKEGIKKYIHFYNTKRFHQSLDYQTPDEKYQSFIEEKTLVKAV
jgi:putative transposase